MPYCSATIATEINMAQEFISSHCVLLPEGLSGMALQRAVQAELQRERQATEASVYAGLHELGQRRALVMAAASGAALGPAVCHHYADQRDFLWLEHRDGADIWDWCLVRAGVPVAEGVASAREAIVQAVRLQQGELTVNSSHRQVRDWLGDKTPDGLRLHWLWLEGGARAALEPCLKLVAETVLLRRIRAASYRRHGWRAALATAALAALAVLWFSSRTGAHSGGAGADRQATVADSLPALLPVVRPTALGLPLSPAMREFYAVLVALWSRGATSVRLHYRLKRSLSQQQLPWLQLTVHSAHPSAPPALMAWARRKGFNAELRDGVLLITGTPQTEATVQQEHIAQAALPSTGAGQSHEPERAFSLPGKEPVLLLWLARDKPAAALLTELRLEVDAHWQLLSGTGQLREPVAAGGQKLGADNTETGHGTDL